jgi:hypothetical protein
MFFMLKDSLRKTAPLQAHQYWLVDSKKRIEGSRNLPEPQRAMRASGSPQAIAAETARIILPSPRIRKPRFEESCSQNLVSAAAYELSLEV